MEKGRDKSFWEWSTREIVPRCNWICSLVNWHWRTACHFRALCFITCFAWTFSSDYLVVWWPSYSIWRLQNVKEMGWGDLIMVMLHSVSGTSRIRNYFIRVCWKMERKMEPGNCVWWWSWFMNSCSCWKTWNDELFDQRTLGSDKTVLLRFRMFEHLVSLQPSNNAKEIYRGTEGIRGENNKCFYVKALCLTGFFFFPKWRKMLLYCLLLSSWNNRG